MTDLGGDNDLPEQDSDPMQLSVHSLPKPKEVGQAVAQQRTKNGRMQMLLVMLICAAPVIASYFTYYVVRPEGRTNHGELINPPVPMPADEQLALTAPDGQTVALSSLKQQWLFITVAGGQCDDLCEQQLYRQRQIREALGKDKDRVDRVWIIPDEQPMREALKAAMKGAWVLHADATQLAAWLNAPQGQSIEKNWYLVDPRGQWMMRFPTSLEERLVYKDLSRLLRAAGDADEAGRP